MTDAERLIERLLARDRDFGRRSDEMPALNNPDGPEAATLIQQQADRIAALEGALRPLAAMRKSTDPMPNAMFPEQNYVSQADLLRREVDAIETRDREIEAARAVLGEKI